MQTWLCCSLIKRNNRNSSSSQLIASFSIESLESSFTNKTTAALCAMAIFFSFFKFSMWFCRHTLQFCTYCYGNWSNELNLHSFDAPWSVWSWITNPYPDPPKGRHPETSLLLSIETEHIKTILTLYTLTSECIFSILFSIYYLGSNRENL